MKRHPELLLALILPATFLVQESIAQTYADASLLLKRAEHEQIVNGDIQQAIALYRQVAESVTASRPDVASALISLGKSYELMRSKEAYPAYRRVVTEFPDQAEAFLTARRALERLSDSRGTSVPSEPAAHQDYTLVMENVPAFPVLLSRMYDYSPDGTTLVITAPILEDRKRAFPTTIRELYLMDVGSSVMRPLLKDPSDWEFLNLPRWSPDGRYVLCSGNRLTGEGGLHKMLLISTASGEATVLNEVVEGESVWLPDGKGFVTLSGDGFRTYSIDGTLRRHFDRRGGDRTRLGDVSPDGTKLLYHRDREGYEVGTEMDVWMLDLNSGEHTQITNFDGFEGQPTWSRDGKSIYYASGVDDVRNVYRLQPGSGKGPEKITSYSNAQVLHPHVLPGTGQLTFGLRRDNNTILVGPAANLDAAKEIVRGGGPMLSPDGNTIYYLDREPGRTGIWSVSRTGSNATQIVAGSVSTSYGSQKLLSPNGDRLAYFLYEGNETTLYVKPTSGGAAKKLYSVDGRQNIVPAWSPDGRELAFAFGRDLSVIAADGGAMEVLARPGVWESWMVEWSPDGSMIAGFAYADGEKENSIYVVNRRTKELKRVTPREESSYKEILAWHPDGRRISYMYYDRAYQNDGSRIVSVDGGASKSLANMADPNWDYIGGWGPDRRYYFSSTPRGAGNDWSVYAVDEATGKYELMHKHAGRSVSLPTWSADGKVVAWDEVEPSRQLWLMTNYE